MALFRLHDWMKAPPPADTDPGEFIKLQGEAFIAMRNVSTKGYELKATQSQAHDRSGCTARALATGVKLALEGLPGRVGPLQRNKS